MKYLYSLSMLFILSNLTAQQGLEYTSNSTYLTIEETDNYLVSEAPITNKEYITYILWTMNVYGSDYPEVVIEAIPGINKEIDSVFIYNFYNDTNSFEFIYKNSAPYVKGYIFNKKYIDYPVIGVSWEQALRFNKWLTDRYNEYKLIKHNYLELTNNQINEDCFVTEAYLAQQYMTGVLTDWDKIALWENKILIPSFRLPTNQELKFSKKKKVVLDILKPYKDDNKEFLQPWIKLNFDVENFSVIPYRENFMGRRNKSIILNNETNSNWNIKKMKLKELTLDNEANLDYSKSFAIKNCILVDEKKYLDEEGWLPEKDSLGNMPYIIIDENSGNTPILINYPYLVGNKKNNELTIFRPVLNMKKGQYKP